MNDAFPETSPPAVEERPARTPPVLKSARRTGRRASRAAFPRWSVGTINGLDQHPGTGTLNKAEEPLPSMTDRP